MLNEWGIWATSDGHIFRGAREMKQFPITCPHKYGKDKTYMGIAFTYKRQGHTLLVHRIVYAYFHGIAHKGLSIDHLDNNPFNNDIDNLEEIEQSENIHRRGIGRNQYNYLMSDEEILAMRKAKEDKKNRKVEIRKEIVEERNRLIWINERIRSLKDTKRKLTDEIKCYHKGCSRWSDLGYAIEYQCLWIDFYKKDAEEVKEKIQNLKKELKEIV